MTLKELVRMLTPETEIIVKDVHTNDVLYYGMAEGAMNYYEVKDWDFSGLHVVYVEQ